MMNKGVYDGAQTKPLIFPLCLDSLVLNPHHNYRYSTSVPQFLSSIHQCRYVPELSPLHSSTTMAAQSLLTNHQQKNMFVDYLKSK